MARCEVCGVEQFPANTVIRHDGAHVRHFFCSVGHADQWNEEVPLPEEPEPREEQSLEEDLWADPPPPVSPAPKRPPAKRPGRPKGSRNKPTPT
jgi:hypothetical protein